MGIWCHQSDGRLWRTLLTILWLPWKMRVGRDARHRKLRSSNTPPFIFSFPLSLFLLCLHKLESKPTEPVPCSALLMEVSFMLPLGTPMLQLEQDRKSWCLFRSKDHRETCETVDLNILLVYPPLLLSPHSPATVCSISIFISFSRVQDPWGKELSRFSLEKACERKELLV